MRLIGGTLDRFGGAGDSADAADAGGAADPDDAGAFESLMHYPRLLLEALSLLPLRQRHIEHLRRGAALRDGVLGHHNVRSAGEGATDVSLGHPRGAVADEDLLVLDEAVVTATYDAGRDVLE